MLQVDNTVYVSGQIGFIPETMEIVTGIIQRIHFKNLDIKSDTGDYFKGLSGYWKKIVLLIVVKLIKQVQNLEISFIRDSW